MYSPSNNFCKLLILNMMFVLLQLLQLKSMHCIFINTVFRGSGDYFKTFIADYKSSPPSPPQDTRICQKNAGWHIWFCRLLVFDRLIGLYQSCQDKAFTEPDCFPEELKPSKKTHRLAQNVHVSSFSFKYRLPHCKKGLKYRLHQNWQCILQWEYQDIHAEQKSSQ